MWLGCTICLLLYDVPMFRVAPQSTRSNTRQVRTILVVGAVAPVATRLCNQLPVGKSLAGKVLLRGLDVYADPGIPSERSMSLPAA
jgi:hypothetical protein